MAVSDKDPAGNLRSVPLESAGPLNTSGSGTGGEWTNDMTQRVSRMEGALDGLKHNQTITFGAIAMVSTILVAVSSYTFLRVDALSARISTLEVRVNELPGKIAAELRDLNNTLAQAITAAKQAPPQVIVIPVPAPANVPSQPPQTP
jgi:hypothetical protein